MLAAGFTADETDELDDSYLDFASQALSYEKRRVVKIRDALIKKVDKAVGAKEPGSAATGETCTEYLDDGTCIQAADGTP